MNIRLRPGLGTGLFVAALLPVASHAAEYATVLSATPVTGTVNVPRRVCSEGQQVVQPQPSGAGAVIGAIAGGLLGNSVGGGFGRAAATGVGVVAGAAIGNSVEANGYPPAVVPVQRCQTVSSYENRAVGYDVVYEYNGRRYSTRMAQDPGPQLAIDVRPANVGAASLDRRGPPTAYAAVPPAYESRAGSLEPAAPEYREQAPAGYYAAPAPVYDGAPVYYGGVPAPVYYGAGAYVAPAIIGAGIGYWVGSSWHRGYRQGHYGRWR